MINSLEITNFRCFERFEARDLARVNLLVGMNNSGKTSLLEAIELWAARGGPYAAQVLQGILERRGEYHRTMEPHQPELSFPVRHLFRGHALELDQWLEIAARHGDMVRPIRATFRSRGTGHPDQSILPGLDEADADGKPVENPSHLLIGKSSSEGYGLRLRPDGTFRGTRFQGIPPQKDVYPTRFVTTQSLAPSEVAILFGEYVLTEEEQRIVSALQIIEPSIERLALAVGDVNHGPERAGIVVKCTGQTQRIPIGSMGDGIWRMLALALGLVGTRGGILLVDEIDTGLHFSVMTRMWRLIIETAQRLDVQVFATSHSRDCYESLATALQDLAPSPGTAAIHRIERDKRRTVAFDDQEIIIAAERGIEVR